MEEISIFKKGIGIIFLLLSLMALAKGLLMLPLGNLNAFIYIFVSIIFYYIGKYFFNKRSLKLKGKQVSLISPSELETENGEFPTILLHHETERHREYYSSNYKTEKDIDITESELDYFEEITDLDQWASYRDTEVFKEFREEITASWISPNIEAISQSDGFFSDFIHGNLNDAIEKWKMALGKNDDTRFNKNLGIAYLLTSDFEKALHNFKEYKEKGTFSEDYGAIDKIIKKLELKGKYIESLNGRTHQ